MRWTNGSKPGALPTSPKRTKMSTTRYSMSFTTGGLFQQESVDLAQHYLSILDWDKLSEQVATQNLLQVRTQSSSTRIAREVISRLKLLSDAELKGLTSASSRDQGYILWVAVCRRYSFIAEFAQEVIRQRYTRLQPDLERTDFDAFLDRKAEWHTELDRLSSSTRLKLRQVFFRILREAGIVSSTLQIQSPIWSAQILELFKTTGTDNLQFFPIFESDLERFAS